MNKKCPKLSRIVPDTEYIANLIKINLKINMLVHTFCAHTFCAHLNLAEDLVGSEP